VFDQFPQTDCRISEPSHPGCPRLPRLTRRASRPAACTRAEPAGEADEALAFSFRGPKSLRCRLRMLAAESDQAVQDVAGEALQH
jgi:hypothetical protein